MENIGLICARKNSKGLKNKNIKLINKKPLIFWSIKQLLKLKNKKIIDRIIVSTDSKKIANISLKYGAEVPFLRPKILSGSNSPEWQVWKHTIKKLEEKNIKINTIINLPATSPCRKLEDVFRGIKMFNTKKFEIVTAITKSSKNPYFNMVKFKNNFAQLVIKPKNKISHRQSAPKVFDLTTAFYITSAKIVKMKKHIFDCKMGSITIDKVSSIDIDDEYDFKMAKLNLKKYERY